MKRVKFKKAQAMLEISLIGIVILMLFGFLIDHIQKMNDEQYVLMANFRKNLKKAHDENATVRYNTFEDVRHVDTDNPLVGKRTPLSASSSVYWAVPPVVASDEDVGEGKKFRSRIIYDPNVEGSISGSEVKIPVIFKDKLNERLYYQVNYDEKDYSEYGSVKIGKQEYRTQTGKTFMRAEAGTKAGSTTVSSIDTFRRAEVKEQRKYTFTDEYDKEIETVNQVWPGLGEPTIKSRGWLTGEHTIAIGGE